jgi:hypothetical protein
MALWHSAKRLMLRHIPWCIAMVLSQQCCHLRD